MIKGHFKKGTVLFVPAYVMERKECELPQGFAPRKTDLPHMYVVWHAGSVPTANKWTYFAWVEMTHGPMFLMEFSQEDLYLSEQSACVAHLAEQDRFHRQVERAKKARAALYRYARCYHHRAQKKGILQRIKNLLAKNTSRTALKSLPARPESTQGQGSSLPALPTLRRML